jgi:hypothetical protein
LARIETAVWGMLEVLRKPVRWKVQLKLSAAAGAAQANAQITLKAKRRVLIGFTSLMEVKF